MSAPDESEEWSFRGRPPSPVGYCGDSFGGVVTSVYDDANRLTERELGGAAPIRLNLGYNNRDELTSLTRYKNTGSWALVGTTTYAPDDAGRLQSITHKNDSSVTINVSVR